jgi:hypothetical protein
MQSSGPNVHGISPEVPEGCTVSSAAYVLRHGSRYPDTGAHNGWLDLARRVSIYTKNNGLRQF